MSKKKNRDEKQGRDGREMQPSADSTKQDDFLKKSVPSSEGAAPLPSDDEIEQSLTAIYQGQPTKEWLNTLDRGRRKIWVMVLGIFLMLVLFASTAAWAGIWWFGNKSFNGKGIELQIEGPRDISIGQEVSYRINWFNITSEPLAATEFRVSFPNDFKVTGVDPKPTSDPLIFRLGAQPVEGRGTIKVTGVFTGAIGTKSAVQVVTTYRPASFNSDFEALNSLDIEYGNSVLQGKLDVPEKVVPGDTVKLTYAITNSGSQKMDGLRAHFILPEGFTLSVSSTKGDDPKVQDIFRDLPSLDAGAATSVTLTGTFAARSGGNLNVVAEAGFSLADGSFAPAQHTETPISVLAGDLDIEIVDNGTQDDRNTTFGEWQRISLSYQNLSGEKLDDIQLMLHIDPSVTSGTSSNVSLVDWSKLNDSQKGTRSGNVIKYTSKEISDLASMEKDKNGFIEVSVPIISSATSGQDVPISISAEAIVAKVGGHKVNRIIHTKPITLRLQTDASVLSIARYATEEGAQVGSGPLPPVVGSSTTYRIEWHVTKTLHSLDQISVSAALPSSVIWVGEREVGAGTVHYDDQKKLVTWTINKMPDDVKDLALTFDITLRPTESDLGRFGQLLGETRMEFTDAILNQTMIRTSPSVTTDLPDDSIAARKGVVSR